MYQLFHLDRGMLKSNVLWPESRRFRSHSDWEPLGFFSEGLCNATCFDLKLGFFSSSAISLLCDGFACFLYNGGRMRLIVNDVLSEQDRDAIIRGNSGDALPYFDLKDISSLKSALSDRDRHFFDCLAWLIRSERIKIVVIRTADGRGVAHTKCGLFSDGINKVAFDGSCNFSRTALIDNCESISAFCDWDGGNDVYKIADIENDFNMTFEGNDSSVRYLGPENIRNGIADTFERKELEELLNDELKFFNMEGRLNSLSMAAQGYLARARKKVEAAVTAMARAAGGNSEVTVEEPCFPYPSGPREYQIQAFDNWKKSQKGLFVMATGTGKTLTSLNCLLKIYQKTHYYKAVILVPTLTLVEQWVAECRKFHFGNIHVVSSKNPHWRHEIDFLLTQEQIHGDDVSYIVVSTYASFARDVVFDSLNSLSRKALLIADEAHNMGAGKILTRLDGIHFKRRIGLSATPYRQYDETGNSKLRAFFDVNGRYTFEYGMAEAISNGFLCRYYYYPHLVYLTEGEMNEYLAISKTLARYFNSNDCSFPSGDDVLTALLLKRKRIIHKAVGKESVFKKIIEDRYKEKGNLKYTLVYVPEGNVTDDNSDLFDSKDSIGLDEESSHLIDRYTEIVKNVSETTTVKKFTSDSAERNRILADFSRGDLEVLTSMKCLDEGVDVPRSEMAIFCASTGNPRQFVQRRGRILRKHKDKYRAVIHDLIVAPWISTAEDSYKMERNLLETELKRVRDFASLSENSDYAYKELENITLNYNLSIL